ncbi:DUF362 domain-containing protein [Candidatus Poribacteria bacterium]
MKFDKGKRDFIKRSIGLGLGIYGVTRLEYPFTGVAEARSNDSKVVIARDKSVINGNFKIDPQIVRKMLDDAVTKLAGTKSASRAWREYYNSDDVVGIKINALSGRWMSSRPELVAAIADGLRLAGVKEKNMIIWDKSDRELVEAGFKLNRKASNDPKCFGTSPHVNYEDDIRMYESIASKLTRIVPACTAFVNVPVLKHHTMAGVTLSLKNWFGAINNPNKYHFDVSSDNFIPDLNTMLFSKSGIGKRQPLIICDAIMAQYDMGPGYRPNKAWNYSGLIVSTDPVALDRIGAQIIERKRREVGLKSLAEMEREPKYISIAADKLHKLGTDDPSKIELVSAGNLITDI